MRKLQLLQSSLCLPGLALLLCGLGCVDFEQEGVSFCEKRSDQCVPVLEEVVQESVLPSGQIVLRVLAKDAAERLVFRWEATNGSLEEGVTTNTSSTAIWKPPACLPLRQSETVFVFVKNSYGEARKDFKVTVDTCPLTSMSFPLTTRPSPSSLGHHSLVLLRNGSVWAWGANESGQLGDDTIQSRTFVSKVSSLEKVAAISSGYVHSLALREDGTVWAWGSNNYGQLGLGGGRDKTSPVRIPTLGEVIFLSAGALHSLALSRNGTVWAWGNNDYGQLGDGSLASRSSPVAVDLRSVSDVVALAAGWSFSMALCVNGEVWGWGYDFSEVSSGPAHIPARVYGLPEVVAIAVGRRHALVLSVDGAVWAWGANDSGQLGVGDRDFESSPKQIPGLSNIRAIAAGSDFSIALGSKGEVWAWGLNDSGQLGDGTKVDRHAPARVSGVSGISSLAAGDRHAVALGADESLWRWGDDGAGRIRLSPERVSIP